MKNLKHCRPNSINFCNRLVYFEFPHGSTEIQNIVQNETVAVLPEVLKNKMTPENFDALSKNVETKGKAAAAEAVKKLAPETSVEAAKVAAREAFRAAARIEIAAAMKNVDQAEVAKLLNNIFNSAADGVAITGAVGGSLVLGGLAGGAPLGVVSAFAGTTLAPILAAGVATGAAGYQAAELQKEIERGGWTTKGKQLDLAKQSAVDTWNIGRLDTKDKRKGDLPSAVDRMGGDWVRGAALLARGTASDINHEISHLNDGVVDKSITLAKIQQMIVYAKEVKIRVDDVSKGTGVKNDSLAYREAQRSSDALDKAIQSAEKLLNSVR